MEQRHRLRLTALALCRGRLTSSRGLQALRPAKFRQTTLLVYRTWKRILPPSGSSQNVRTGTAPTTYKCTSKKQKQGSSPQPRAGSCSRAVNQPVYFENRPDSLNPLSAFQVPLSNP